MTRTGGRNNLLAGGFVIASVLLAVWVSFKLADRSGFGSTREFTIRFSLREGAVGLKRGSIVTLGGQQIGRVLSVDFARAGPGALAEGVDVRVEVRADLTLYENAPVYLSLPLLGTLSSINFAGVGTPQAVASRGGPAIEDGDTVAGRLAPPAFLAGAGFGEDQANQVRQAINMLEGALSRAQKLIDANAPLIDRTLADIQSTATSLRASVEQWSRQADAVMANAARASERIDPLLSSAQQGVDDARALVADARAALGENRAAIDDIIARLQSASQKLDTSSLDLLNSTLASAKEALAGFDEAIGQVAGLVAQETPGLRRTIANMRLMSDQLKLTAIEVRAQPWRLLHTPSTKETESQVLYGAVRSYAQATGDLRAATEALAAVAGSPNPPGDESLAEVTRRVNEAYEQYRIAQRYFLDKLIDKERK